MTPVIAAFDPGAYFNQARVEAIASAVLTLVVGLILARLLGRLIERASTKRLTAQQAMLLRRFVTYLIVILSVISALRHLGVDLSVLVGAAGILTVAIGFASQASASNLISGIFLLAEKPFVVGDVIRIGTTTGRVVAIDVLSVKLCTFDNLFVRIPNETLLKAEITNLTHYPVRRVDLIVGVEYATDLAQATDVLKGVAVADTRIMDEPEPQVRIVEFADSAIQIQFVVWTTTDNYADVLFSVRSAIFEAFQANAIVIPFPQRVLHTVEPKPVAAA